MKLNKETQWTRLCPGCENIITYTQKCSRDRAEREKFLCKSCAKSGKNHPNYGKEGYWKDKKNPEQSKRMIGENNSAYGIKRSEKTKQKMSLSATKRFENPRERLKSRLRRLNDIKEKFGQCVPNYNPSAISIIETKAKELGITDLQHAENGGEFQVAGYFVDGYSKEHNIVIEYYESFHERQKERDERRKQEIIVELDCEFIEIKELEVMNGTQI